MVKILLGLMLSEYITIATFGNGTDFGDLTDDRRSAGAFDNSVRGCLLEVMIVVVVEIIVIL